jgi:hypothetical protein
MAFSDVFSLLDTFCPPSDSHTPPPIFPYTQNIENTASPAPEPLMPDWPRPLSRCDSSNDSVAQPRLLPEPTRKRRIECVGEPGAGSLPASSSKPLRSFKRPKNAVRETPAFACPLYKHSPSRFGGPRGCADWCTIEIHRLYSVRQPDYVNNHIH